MGFVLWFFFFYICMQICESSGGLQEAEEAGAHEV